MAAGGGASCPASCFPARVPIAEVLPSRTLAIIARGPMLESHAIAALIRLLRRHAARLPAGRVR